MTVQCLSGRKLSECGIFGGFSEEGDGGLRLAADAQEGYFVSHTYDSGESDMQWNRLILTIDWWAAVRAHVWLFDRREEGEAADEEAADQEAADQEAADEEAADQEAAARLTMARRKYEYVERRAQYHSDYRKMLLYGKERGRGRYAKLAVAVFPKGESEDRIFWGYDLSFPKESFTRYLPAIYRENLPLERFLAVQQDFYLDRERQIDSLAEAMDYENCDGKWAVRLAKWVGWGELASKVDQDTLRKLLRTGTSLISRKGTGGYYRELTEILTGKKTIIVEDSEKCTATVLVLEKPAPSWEKGLDWLRQNVPIGLDVRFVILDKTDRLDERFFLDHTATLSEYESELPCEGVEIESFRLL